MKIVSNNETVVKDQIPEKVKNKQLVKAKEWLAFDEFQKIPKFLFLTQKGKECYLQT